MQYTIFFISIVVVRVYDLRYLYVLELTRPVVFCDFVGDRFNMRSNRHRVDADGVDVHRLAAVGRLATRSVLSLHRAQLAHTIAVQYTQQRSGLLSHA